MKGIYDTWVDEGILDQKLKDIKGWATRGVKNDDIAKNLGIVRSAFYNLMKQHPDVKKACARGKEQADMEVEDALFRRACGYNVTETTENFDKNGESLGRTEKVRHIAGEVSAQIFWLKNRAQNRWRDRIIEEEETEIPKAVELKFVDASIPKEEENGQGNNRDS